MDKDTFRDQLRLYIKNYNLGNHFGPNESRTWWSVVKHIDDTMFKNAMSYLMEKNIRPFGLMIVVRLAKAWQKDEKYKILEAEMKNMKPDSSTKKKIMKFREFVEELHERFKAQRCTGQEAIESAREMSQRLRIEFQIPVDHPGESAKQHQYDAHRLFREWVLDSWEKRLN